MCPSNLRSHAGTVLWILLGACCVNLVIAAEGDVKLVGSGYRGRLEIYHNGEWGTVCKDSFDDIDAVIACYNLGYHGDGKISTRSSTESFGSGRIWLDNMRCSGDEDRLVECNHNGWGRHNCIREDDVFIYCFNPYPRLVSTEYSTNPRRVKGRLEIMVKGKWGTVCDRSFTSNEGKTACKHIGYADGTADYTVSSGSGNIWLAMLDGCGISETRLYHCSRSDWGDNTCEHHEDVGVQCWCDSSTKWGTECRDCGKCVGETCALENGHCSPCKPWYTLSTCTSHIAQKNLTEDGLDVKVIDLSAQIQFHQINVTADLANYYYYIVSYKSLKTNVTTEKNISYNTKDGIMSVDLDGLDPVANYTVKVIPYRHDVHNGLHEAGHPSREATFETDCQPGFWSKASDCNEVCGNCSSERCEGKNGHCKPPVCDMWYAPPMCVTPIMTPNMSDHQSYLAWVTFHSAKIQFQQLILDVEVLAPFYFYVIEYHQTEGKNVELFYKVVRHNMSVGTASSIFDRLRPNTNYTVKITPYRTDKGVREKGEPTIKELIFRTDCKPGWFGGRACNTQCSDHCRLGQCDRYTGYCTCDIWYVSPLCKHFIANPDGKSQTISVSSSTTTKVKIQFQQLSLNDFIDDYYCYGVQYKEPGGSFKEAKVLPHRKEESLIDTTIEGLEAGKDYVVRVVPYRNDFFYQAVNAGSPTSDVAVTTQCPEGTFGFTCIKKCHCNSGPCDLRTGICKTPGCKNWWTLDNCTLPIREPNMTENNLTVLSESDTSLDVSFEALDISDNMSAFYGYSVQYNVSSGGNNMTVDDNNDREVYYNNVTVHHDNSSMLNVTIAGLEPNSTYIIRVLPFRMDLANDLMETGLPTPVISADTTPKSTLTATEGNVAAVVGSVVGWLLPVALVAAGAVYVTMVTVALRMTQTKKLSMQKQRRPELVN